MIGCDIFEKYGANLSRLEIIFCSRVKWKVEGEEKQALKTVNSEAAALAGVLGAILKANSIRFQPRRNPAALADPAEVDDSMTPEMLNRYASYLKQLNAWFATRQAAPVAEDAVFAAQKLHCSAGTIEEATRMMIDEPAAPAPKRAPRARTTEAAEPKVRELVRDPATIDREKSRLKLESSFEQPLLFTEQNFTRLTDHAIALLDAYLTENSIELSGFQLRRFHDNVKRWILATPENQTLVLKIGPYQLEPYSSYVIED